MKSIHLLFVLLMAGTLVGTPAFAEFKTVADPSRAEFGFEESAVGTNIFTLGGPPWTNIGNRLTGVVQTGDGMGGGTAGAGTLNDAGLQSALIDPVSGNSKMILSMNPKTLPGHTARASFAFQAATGNGDFEWDMFLEGSNPDTFRAVWISADNGQLRTRDAANGNAVSVVGNYEAGNWYELVWEKPVWSDGSAGQPFTVSLYDSSTGQVIGSIQETLGKDLANFNYWNISVANADGNTLNVDHFSYVLDDAGAALPAFVPRGGAAIPEPAMVSLFGMMALGMLRRRRSS